MEGKLRNRSTKVRRKKKEKRVGGLESGVSGWGWVVVEKSERLGQNKPSDAHCVLELHKKGFSVLLASLCFKNLISLTVLKRGCRGEHH